MVIGTWKTSALLGLVAGTLWGVALVWYFIGNYRLARWWRDLRARLGLKPRQEGG